MIFGSKVGQNCNFCFWALFGQILSKILESWCKAEEANIDLCDGSLFPRVGPAQIWWKRDLDLVKIGHMA